MRLIQVALLAAAAMAAVEPSDGSCLHALQKMFQDSDLDSVQAAAKWLEDNFGASTAEDLKGVSNFAVDGMSLVRSDKSLRQSAKQVLHRLFGQDKVASDKTALDVLKKEFPDIPLHVLQSAAKWLEDNFGATTAEDLDGVSEWAVNGMTLAAGD